MGIELIFKCIATVMYIVMEGAVITTQINFFDDEDFRTYGLLAAGGIALTITYIYFIWP